MSCRTDPQLITDRIVKNPTVNAGWSSCMHSMKKIYFFYFHDKPPSGQRLTAPDGHLLIPKALLHICHPAASPSNIVARTSSSHITHGLNPYINSVFFWGVSVPIMTFTTIEQLWSFYSSHNGQVSYMWHHLLFIFFSVLVLSFWKCKWLIFCTSCICWFSVFGVTWFSSNY